jgi:DNA polymerase-3 subunit delta
MKPIYLFHGEDNYTSSQKALHWQKEFEKKYGDIETFENLTVEKFIEAITTLPFLSEKKLIIIKDFFSNAKTEDLKKIAEKLDKVDENCIVVFIEKQKADARTSLFKNIKKMGQIIEFNPLEQSELIKWIELQVKKRGGIIKRPESIKLAETIGPNLWQMEQEIEKLTMYSNGNPITSEAIESLTTPNLTASIFRLTDQISLNQSKEALKTLEILIENGENPIQILFMIIRHFRILIQIKDCLAKNVNSSLIVKKTKTHPYAVNIGIKQSQKFDQKKLTQIYQALQKIDIAIKGGEIRITTNDISELRLAIEKFITKFASQRSRA